MPTFVTTHQAPSLSDEELANTAPDVAESKYATFRQLFANKYNGYIVTIYDADDQSALEREFERMGFPFVEIHEVHFALDAQALQAIAAGGAA